jgi:nucleoside-diphosphate-sugar epimerase
MKAIIEAGVETKMKRLVVTSSFAAVAGGLYKKEQGNPNYSEKDFPPTEGADFYAVGKIF